MKPIPTGYVELELPAEDEPLRAGDVVDLEFPFLDEGTWIESFHINRIEKEFLDDDRLFLQSYSIDRDNQLISFRVEVLSNNVARTDTPAYLVSSLVVTGMAVCIALLVTIFMTAASTWLILSRRRVRVSRKAQVFLEKTIESPDATLEEKQAAEEILEAAKRGDETTTQEAVVAASWAIGLLVGVVIIRMFIK